jgi:transforming growth factor-beta-induced protein
LDQPGDVTFFAPTNNAFTSIPEELLELLFLRDEFAPHLEDLLLYHALEGKRLVQDFLALEIITTFKTEGVLVRQDPLTINGITVWKPNNNASNGVSHVINGVLQPDWVTNSIIGFVSSMDDMSLLFEFPERAGLVQELDTLGDELTLVGPTNDAFTALGEELLGFLRDPDNQKSLVAILQYHIILGVFTSPDLVDGGILDTRNRRRSVEVSVGILDTRNRRRSVEVSVGDTLMFNQANVVRRNGVNGVASDSMLANNGVLLKIDAVMNPDSLNGF